MWQSRPNRSLFPLLALTFAVAACDEMSNSLPILDVADTVSEADTVGLIDTGDATEIPDTGAVDVAVNDTTDCSAQPPEGPGDLVCQTWHCEEQPFPTCWWCGVVSAEGEGCDVPDTGDPGICRDSGCVPLDDPGLAGEVPFSVGAYELVLGDTDRPPKAEIALYIPDEEGPFPVVIFHHGFQLGTDSYASYGEHLASSGYLVVMPEMPGGLVGGPTHVDLQGYLTTVIDWIVRDAAHVDGRLGGKADAERIGLAGHSMGAKISLLVATEDGRPDAIFAIDPVDSAGGPMPVSPADYPSVTPELMDQIDVPAVFLGETTNGTCEGFLCQPCAPQPDNFHQYYEHATSSCLEIEVVGANHMSFLDNPNCGLTCSVCPVGTDDPATTRLLTRRYMTAFFNVFLRDQDVYRTFLTGLAMDDDVAAGLVSSQSKNGF